MELPKSALIIGEDPTTQAVCQTLALFGVKHHPYKTSLPLNQQPPHLHECDLVIAIASHYTEVMPLIHQLRGTWGWEGKFLAIVPNQEQKDALEQKSLFGTSNYKLYGQTDGHAVITVNSPQFLSKLLHNIKKLNQSVRGLKLYYEIWNKWYSGCLVIKLRRRIEGISHRIKQQTVINDNLKQDLIIVLEIITKIQWFDIVNNPHQDLKKVNTFIAGECKAIKEKINNLEINSEAIKQFCDQVESNLLNHTFIKQCQSDFNPTSENDRVLDMKPQTSDKKYQSKENTTKLKKDSEQSKGLKILIVEDNDKWAATLYRLYKSIICEKYSPDEWDISTAICAEQALDKLERGEKFDLISLDINLSKTDQDWGDGRLVLKKAAELKSCKAMIVITGMSLDEPGILQEDEIRGDAVSEINNYLNQSFLFRLFLSKTLKNPSRIAETDPDIKLKVENWREKNEIIEIENIISSLKPDNTPQISDKSSSQSPKVYPPYVIEYNDSKIKICNENNQEQWILILASKQQKVFNFLSSVFQKRSLEFQEIIGILGVKPRKKSNPNKSAYNAVNDNVTPYLKERGIDTSQIYSCRTTTGKCELYIDKSKIKKVN